MQAQGQFKQIDFFDNQEGLNLVDSPFKVKDGQATAGQNYNYTQTGGFRKRQGHAKINSSADTQTKSLGLALYNTTAGTKTNIRAAGTKVQALDTSVPSFTNLSEDTTAAGTDFLTSGSAVPVVASAFNTASLSALWLAGGGMSSVYGAYSSTKVTKNGVDAPGGSISTSVTTPGTGTFSSTGAYRYAVALRKASTQALSNASFSQSATVAATSNNVVIDLTAITGVDTTKHDKFYIYRSAVSGSEGFTTGDLVAIVDSTATSYTDTGSYSATSQNVPRSGNTTLDNGVLPSGTYKTLTTFKRRLVTATGSTVYLSDLNKPESWPATNVITIPSGGDIKSLSIISFTSAGSNTIDEILCVHKENELWVITGDSVSDWALKFIDNTGSVNQSNVVSANGYLFWISLDDVYMWSGSGKPVKLSRLIKPLFYPDGDLDKARLSYGVGKYYKKLDQIVWFISHKTFGEQKCALKLDLKLTLPSVNSSLGGTAIDGVFLMDSLAFGVYAADTYYPNTPDEVLILGDDSGYVYNAYSAESDASAAFSFKYATRQLDCGNPNSTKRYHYVVVWVEEVGTWNLTLDWWTDYRAADVVKSTRALPISERESGLTALWDIAQWEQAYWDDYTPQLRPLIFELSSDQNNNNEGRSIRLQFRQDGADQPVTISGYTLIYSDSGLSMVA